MHTLVGTCSLPPCLFSHGPYELTVASAVLVRKYALRRRSSMIRTSYELQKRHFRISRPVELFTTGVASPAA